MLKYLGFLSILILPVVLSPQQATDDWVETEATILEIHNKRRAKSTRAFATVSYMTNDGEEHKTQVEVLAIPLFGTTKSVNDTITVLYDPAQPMMAITPSSSFIESYGMYLLIGAGFVFSLFNLRKMMSKKRSG